MNGRPPEEEKKQSALAASGFGGDFNLAGTQIGGQTPQLTSSTKDSTTMGAESSGGGRIQMGRSFARRPHSLNNRGGNIPPEEEKKYSTPRNFELNATGRGV